MVSWFPPVGMELKFNAFGAFSFVKVPWRFRFYFN